MIARPSRLFPILLVNFIGTLGFSIVLPFLVVLVDRFGGNALVYGLLGATYSSFQLVGAPILGRWSDRYGRKKILLASQLGTLLSWCVFLLALFLPARELAAIDSSALGVFSLSLPLVVVFLARALDGATGGNVSVANAYLADVTEKGDRKESFGSMAVAGNLGFIIGPVLAGLLGGSRFGELLPVLAALVISGAASIVIWLYLPESRHACPAAEIPEDASVRKTFGQEQRNCYGKERASDKGIRDVVGLSEVPFLLLLYFVIFLSFNLFYTAFPMHAVRGLSWTITEIGVFFSFLGLTSVLVQGPLLKRIGPRASNLTLTVLGAGILGLGFLCFQSGHPAVLYVGGGLFSLGNGLLWPSFMARLADAAGEELQGVVQGLGGGVGSLASIVGLIAGGIAYEQVFERTFLLSALLIFAVALLSLGIRARQRRARKARST